MKGIGVVAALTVTLSVLATTAGSTIVASSAACGGATASVIASVDSGVMAAVHRVELNGSEVTLDTAHVTGARDLARAVAADNRAATLNAVQRIVHHGFWHIVRLRVTDTAGRLLADVGGSDVISPVPGVLRSDGRVVGHFLMSVQDDAGFVRLEHRFVGDPAGIYLRGALAFGLPPTLPRRLPATGSVRIGGVRSLISSQQFAAFPSGTLRFSLLVGTPPATVAALPCSLVRVDEFGSVAAHLSRVFNPLPHYGPYAFTVALYTGALVFVRDGATQLASSAGAGPATLPTSGTVSYEGTNWTVFSFEARPPARIYLLVAPG